MKLYIKPAIDIEMVQIETFLAQSTVDYDPNGTGGTDANGGAEPVKEEIIFW